MSNLNIFPYLGLICTWHGTRFGKLQLVASVMRAVSSRLPAAFRAPHKANEAFHGNACLRCRGLCFTSTRNSSYKSMRSLFMRYCCDAIRHNVADERAFRISFMGLVSARKHFCSQTIFKLAKLLMGLRIRVSGIDVAKVRSLTKWLSSCLSKISRS